jgi:hypothetical protein
MGRVSGPSRVVKAIQGAHDVLLLPKSRSSNRKDLIQSWKAWTIRNLFSIELSLRRKNISGRRIKLSITVTCLHWKKADRQCDVGSVCVLNIFESMHSLSPCGSWSARILVFQTIRKTHDDGHMLPWTWLLCNKTAQELGNACRGHIRKWCWNSCGIDPSKP